MIYLSSPLICESPEVSLCIRHEAPRLSDYYSLLLCLSVCPSVYIDVYTRIGMRLSVYFESMSDRIKVLLARVRQ